MEPKALKEPKTLKERAREEFRRFVTMFLYLWVMFSLFQLHEFLVLAGQGLPYVKIGFALVNALVFAKVMLLGEAIPVAAGCAKSRCTSPSWPGRSCSPCCSSSRMCWSATDRGAVPPPRVADSLPSPAADCWARSRGPSS